MTEEQFSFESDIKQLMYLAEQNKNNSSTNVVARRWAVFYTEAEKLLAYYQAMLASKPDAEGDSVNRT